MSYLKKRHNTWYARLGIPESARPILGRTEFVKSLQTASRSTAERRATAYISEWKEAIATALSFDPIKREALWWWQAYKDESCNSKVDQLLHAISDRAEGWERKEGLEEAKRFHEIATGKSIELSDYVESWYEKRLTEVSEHFAFTSRQRIYRMAKRFKLSSNVNRKDVEAWIEEQLAEKAVITVRKIIKACDDYWQYLQKRELIESGPSPFDNHEIKPKAKESLYKDMQPYTVEELRKLLRIAESKGKTNLTYAIRIAAYTGFRQDEICKLQTEDVIEEDGITCLVLRDSKTKSGLRTIPVADRLLPLVQELKAKALERGDEYLLADENIDRYGKRSKNISKQFAKLKTDLGFGERHDFHSIRRTVATLLEKGRVEELHAARLLGHKLKTTSYGLYSGGTAMDILKEAIEVLDYGKGF